MSTTAISPKDALLAGSEILSEMLLPYGFVFVYAGEGHSSGGHSASGEFVFNDRRLEFHYRGSLGLVTYHIGKHHAAHETYMRQLGVLGKNRYPGFSTNLLQGFRDLAHDLRFASDFTSGDAQVLTAAAQTDMRAQAEESRELRSRYSGDTDTLKMMRELFQQKRYAEALSAFEALKYPDRMTEVELKIAVIARERARR